MRLPREDRYDLIEPLLPLVEKPSRYLDHEWGAETDQSGPFHVCLMYPDVYEVGLPNMGLAILYRTLNAQPGMSCERGYLPWVDMADLMRERRVPLLSLECSAPVASFDVVGFTLAHEMACTNILESLDLAGIPLLAADRDEDDPIVIAGGPSVWNCEPVAELFDAVLLGDGEEGIVDMCACVRDGRAAGLSREELLLSLAAIPGVYVPSLYEVVVDETSTRWGYARPLPDTPAPEVVLKRSYADLSKSDPLPQTIVPYMGVVQDRLAIEVLRGCARGCRFCQAGMSYRPVRERPFDQVVDACREGLAITGHDEVSLTSLSTTDHSQCAQILHQLNADARERGVRVSIPSQRLDSFGVEMAAEVGGAKKGGLTFAPEAGSQRLRDVINKNVTEKNIDLAARNAFENGWRRMKLYFMMGLPTETRGPRPRDRPRRGRQGPQERRLGLHLGRRLRAQGPHALPVGRPAPARRGPPPPAAAPALLPRPRDSHLLPRRRGLPRRGRPLQDGPRRPAPRDGRLEAWLPLRRLDRPVLLRALGRGGPRGRPRPRGRRRRVLRPRRAPAVGAHLACRLQGLPQEGVAPRRPRHDYGRLHHGDLRGLRRLPHARRREPDCG